jgi:hypothetical protein
MNSFGLPVVITIDRANDNSVMLWIVAMKTNKISTIERQDRASPLDGES